MDQTEEERNVRQRSRSDGQPSNEHFPQLFPPTTSTTMYSSVNDYVTAVRAWLWAYHTWHFTQMLAPLYVQQFLYLQQQQLRSTSPQTQPSLPPAGTSVSPVSPLTGNRYVIPAFGRRLLAEALDFAFCFVLSLFVTYILVEAGIIELSRYEKLLSDQADVKTLIDVTQDLFPIEIGKKVLTSLIEAFFIAYGVGIIPAGSTPGKHLMGLKVIKCTSAQAVAPRDYRVIIYNDGERVSFSRAFIRSMIKNFTLGFLFPLCITMYVFQFNRALYDIAAGTIVVEA